MKLSILICTVPTRVNLLIRLLGILFSQADHFRDDVEVIYLGDNKKRTTGQKRNDLIRLAQGDFVTFIDDDDRVTDEYIPSILASLAANPDADCVVFDTSTNHLETGVSKRNKVGIEFDYTETADLVTCRPSHTMVWARHIAKSAEFPEISEGEDVKWVAKVWPLIQKQVRIDKLLYHYDFDARRSER